MTAEHLHLRKCPDGYFRTSWTDDNGVRRHKSFGKARAQAFNMFTKFFEKWKTDPTVRNPSDEGPLTIRQAWTRFDTHAQAYYRRPDGSATGEAQDLTYSFQPVLDLFGDEPASQFGPKALKQCRDRMVEEDLSVNVINSRIRKIRQVFKWLAGEELISATVWHSLQTIEALKPGRTAEARINEPVTPVPDQWVWQTCKHLPTTLRAMVEFQYWTGCRPQDVCGLTTGAIDTKGSVWLYRPVQHKTAYRGHDRVVLIGPKAKAIIEPFLKSKTTEAIFTPIQAVLERQTAKVAAYKPPANARGDYRKWPSYLQRVAAKGGSRYRPHWTTQSYGYAIRTACADNNIPHWSPNQLRHNAATRLRKEFGLDVAQIVLGHASADITQVYAEVDMEKAVRVMERVG